MTIKTCKCGTVSPFLDYQHNELDRSYRLKLYNCPNCRTTFAVKEKLYPTITKSKLIKKYLSTRQKSRDYKQLVKDAGKNHLLDYIGNIDIDFDVNSRIVLEAMALYQIDIDLENNNIDCIYTLVHQVYDKHDLEEILEIPAPENETEAENKIDERLGK